MHLKLTTLLLPLLLSATSATSTPSNPQTTHHSHSHHHLHSHAPRRFPTFLDKPSWGAAAVPPPHSGNTSSPASANCTCVSARSPTTTSSLSNRTASRLPPAPRHAPPPRSYSPHAKPFPDMPAHQPANFWAHATPAAEAKTESAPRHPHAPRRFPVFLGTPDWGAAALSTASSSPAGVAAWQTASGNASSTSEGGAECICALPGGVVRGTGTTTTTESAAANSFEIATTRSLALFTLALATPTPALQAPPPLLPKRQTEEVQSTRTLPGGTATADGQDTYTRCSEVPAGASRDGSGVVACQTFVARKGDAGGMRGGKRGGVMAVMAGGVALGVGLVL